MICTGSGNENYYHSLFSISFQLNYFPSSSPISTKKKKAITLSINDFFLQGNYGIQQWI